MRGRHTKKKEDESIILCRNTKNELVSNRFVRELEKKEEYIYFSKEIDCGVGFVALRGALFSDMPIYFRIKLIVKFIWRCLRKK